MNGDAITLPEFYDHMGMKQTAQVDTGKGGATQVRVIGSFGLQTLQELVDQKILMQMAKDASVVPTDAEIDAELKFQTQLRPDYTTILQEQGLTTEMIRHELAVGLAREHLTMNGVVVSPAEVDAYIKQNPNKFSDPATARLLYVQVSSKDKQAKVDAALASGKIFGSVATDFSEAAHARDTGGAFPTDKVSEMPPKLQDLVNKTSVNSKPDWVVDGKNFLKFFVVNKTGPKPHAPSDAQRELVRKRDRARTWRSEKPLRDHVLSEAKHRKNRRVDPIP